MKGSQFESRPIGEAEFARLQALAEALVKLSPELSDMTSVEVDSQEDLGHQGVMYHPAALGAEASEVSGRALQAFARYKRGQGVGWGEYEDLLVSFKALIEKIDPNSEALQI